MEIIIYRNESGGVSLITPSGTIEACVKDIPEGVEFEIVDASGVPSDGTLQNAWELKESEICVNLDKAKFILHNRRRDVRSIEFAPLDVKVTISFEKDQAEIERQEIRDRYALMQIQIDAATTIEELRTVFLT